MLYLGAWQPYRWIPFAALVGNLVMIWQHGAALRLAIFTTFAGLAALLGQPAPAQANCSLVSTEWQCTAGSFSGTVGAEETMSLTSGSLDITNGAEVNGNVAVQGGWLSGNTSNFTNHSAANSSITISGTGSMSFNQSTDGTYAGNITKTGTGRLVKTDAGRLVLTGNNSLGLFEVQQGSVSGNTSSLNATQINGNPGSTLEFDQETDAIYNGLINTNGSLVKTGAGRVLFNASTVNSARIDVQQGTLAVANTAQFTNASVSSGATFEFAQNANSSIAGRIANNGSVSKTGTGQLTVNGNISGSGQILVQAGTLVGNSTVLGNRINIGGNGSLEFAQSSDGEYAHNLSGTGALIKSGTGRLLLSGNNSLFGGQTTVSAGTLAGNTSTLGNNISVSGASVEFAQDSDGTYGGTISGSGNILKTGAGRVLVTGNAGVSGYIWVQGGTFAGNTSTLNSTVRLDSAGTVEFAQDADGTFANRIQGNGTVFKSGTGRVLLTGNNSTTFTSFVQAGTLAGNNSTMGSNISLSSNGTAEFLQAADGTYAGGVHGNGTLLKTGDGKLTLTGNYSVRNATISAGELALQGNMTQSMNASVQSGGRLSGVGSFNTLNVAGTFAPQSYSGVTANSLSMTSGGVFEVRMTDTGQADRLDVTGVAALNGATLRILPQAGNFSTSGVTGTILTAGNISGTFGTTSVDTATFRATLNYQDQEVQLTLAQVKKLREAVAQAPNQGAAGVLDQIAASGSVSTGMNNLLSNLYSLDQATLDRTMHTLSGTETTSVSAMGTASTAALTGGIAQRMADLRFNSGGGGGGGSGSLLTQMAYAGGNPDLAMSRMTEMAEQAAADRQRALGVGGSNVSSDKSALWLRGIAGWGARDADSSFSKQTYQMHGAVFGADMPLTDSFTAGTAFGYANGSSRTSDLTLRGDSSTFFGSIYGGWHRDDWHIDGSLGLARHRLSSDRYILLGGTTSKAVGEHTAFELMSDIGTSYRFHLGNETTFEPLIGLSMSKLWDEAWTETGAGAANLRVGESDRFSATSRVGFALWRTFRRENGLVLTPQFEAMWLRALADRETSLVAGFAEASASTWQVAGRLDPLNSVMVGLSGTAEFDNVSLSLGWAGRFAADSVDHAVRLRVGLSW